MSGPSLITLGLAAVVAVANWRAVLIGARPLEYVAKPLTIVLLFATALLLEPAAATQRDWFLAALVASMVGDVALMLPSAQASGSRHVAAASSPPATFLVGLLAFLLAHLGYLGGLLFGDQHVAGLVVGAALTVVTAATFGRAIVRGSMRAGDRRVAVAVVSYLVAISGMVIAAYGSGRPFAIVGATLFLGSDVLIGWNRFVRSMAWARIAIMVTYHLGQAGLVLALLG